MNHIVGSIVPVSGIYEVVDPRGNATGRTIVLSKGDRFPPRRTPGERYRFREEITNVYTTATSAFVMSSTSTEYRSVLERLAKK